MAISEVDYLNLGKKAPELIYSIEEQPSGTAKIDTNITIDPNKTYFCFGDTTRAGYQYWCVIQNGEKVYTKGSGAYQQFIIEDGKIKINVTATSSVPTWYLYSYIYEV